MSSITKVALAGATGNLGPTILDQLLKADFKVTVLTRQNTSHTFPPSVTVRHVDYTSLPSLTTALHGQDALISTLAYTALTTQLLLVEAAAKANIKRFIPSEFGSNTLNEKVRTLPIFKDKILVQDALRTEAASASGMSYSLICTGPFLDWGLKVGFWMDLKAKTIDLYDGGERVFSATSLATIGKAVVGVLSHLEETRNRAVYVHDVATTLKRFSAIGQQVTKDRDGEWRERVVGTEGLLEGAEKEMGKERPDGMVVEFGFIKAAVWGVGYGSLFEEVDNELLGIEGMGEAELGGMMRGLVG